MNEYVIKNLTQMGAVRWSMGKYDMLYLKKAAQTIVGLEVAETMKNPKFALLAYFDGKKIPCFYADTIIEALDHCFIDLHTGKVYIPPFRTEGYSNTIKICELEDIIIRRINEYIKTMTAGPSSTTPKEV